MEPVLTLSDQTSTFFKLSFESYGTTCGGGGRKCRSSNERGTATVHPRKTDLGYREASRMHCDPSYRGIFSLIFKEPVLTLSDHTFSKSFYSVEQFMGGGRGESADPIIKQGSLLFILRKMIEDTEKLRECIVILPIEVLGYFSSSLPNLF